MLNKPFLSTLACALILLFASSCGGKAEKPNILLITVDTLRADHVGAYGYHRQTTPFIDKLAREGLMFKHVVTPQPQTSGSHASILTSLHPLTHGLIFNALSLHPKAQTIAQVMKKNGYYTMGAVSVKILSRKFNFHRGFDSFSDKWDAQPIYQTLRKKKKKLGKSERTAPSTNKSLFEQIREYKGKHSEKPLFIWLHYYDPHRPYFERKEIVFKNKLPLLPGQHETDLENYDREIRFTDRAIKEVFTFLESEGLTRRLLTSITADHGEGFGEHKQRRGHVDFYSAATHVPLIFHGPGIPAGEQVEPYVSTLDIAVTLLGEAGLSFDAPTEGIDLMEKYRRGFEKTRKRKFLVINSQKWSRSLQMVGSPYAYILNFDRHYLYWYLAMSPDASLSPVKEELFTNLPKTRMSENEKKGKITFHPPPMRKPGLHYLVIRTESVQAPHITVQVETFPQFLSKPRNIGLPDVSQTHPSRRTLEIIYPVTVTDQLKIHLDIKDAGSAVPGQTRYAFIPEPELAPYLAGLKDVDETYRNRIVNWLWALFLTHRKNSKSDELFDLSKDPAMAHNLAGSRELKRFIIRYKKLIYQAYQYYARKKDKLYRGLITGKKRSAEDEDLLKSLGYL
jgi:arylsulfatase A-like enzyme